MSAKKKLLVIDDELDLLEVIKFRLESDGYEVFAASDGMTGIKRAEENMPDLIVLDIMMPGLNGFEVLRKLRDKDSPVKDVPVVMLSCSTEEQRAEKISRDLGAEAYIIKPYRHEEMMYIIERLIADKKKKA